MSQQLETTAGISLTKTAQERMERYLSSEAGSKGIRVGIKKRGCSGYQYVIETAMHPKEAERVYEISHIALFIDDETMSFIQGSMIDFIKEGFNEKFVFRNPNETGICGCGESFTVKHNK